MVLEISARFIVVIGRRFAFKQSARRRISIRSRGSLSGNPAMRASRRHREKEKDGGENAVNPVGTNNERGDPQERGEERRGEERTGEERREEARQAKPSAKQSEAKRCKKARSAGARSNSAESKREFRVIR